MAHTWQKLFFYYHPVFLEHLPGLRHPENPDRLNGILQYLQEQKIWEKLSHKTPSPADPKWIETSHSLEYIGSIEETCRRAPAILDGGDTLVTAHSYEAALYAVGACIAGVDDLMNNATDSVFCAVRPPGHHAEYAEAMGFCLFNNVAIAARYAIDRHSLQRIFILDWDVHHGNGTQNSFYESAEVFFCSIHEWPLYPGSGVANEKGRGIGRGYTLNIPLTAGAGDREYYAALQEQIIPALRHYNPDLLILSAGFDAHDDDPLAQMRLSTNAYREMTRMLRREMKELNGVKILSVLEGGYHHHNLAESVLAHLEALVEENGSV
jgi:acetoin utilization deacetylase AcuC-like enzyme